MPFLLLLFVLAGLTWGQAAESEPLKVGVFDRPPYALKDDTGEWAGLGVELWEDIAEELQLTFEYVEMPVEDLLNALHEGRIDVAVGEIGVSAERERLVDFTQPFVLDTAAAAVARNSAHVDWRVFFSGLSEHGFIKVLLVMLGTLFFFSLLLWIVERGIHQSHFGGKPIHGFGSALWFSAVTMTTVGYGDKTPQTPVGRLLAFLWMFSGILLVSAFTGTVASNVTVARLNSTVIHPSDLERFRNGVLADSLADEYLKHLGIAARSFPSVEDGLTALQQKKISAFLGDQIALRYLISRHDPAAFQVIPLPSVHISYALAMRPDFPLFEAVNVALINRINSSTWPRKVASWTTGSAVREDTKN